MNADSLRKAYLDFFRERGHRVFGSDSLIPAGDPSLLFTGAGMNQFKPYFLGLKKDVRRAASCQKCLRTADLDRVGKTAYHHTFFEMLGNFSFGDYFKEEAIAWGWEFVTKVLGLPPGRLWVSVYEEDEEARQLWKTKIGLPESRIVRMDARDNFWPANAKEDGPNGPCGPCSEIYAGETPGKGVEIWNLVFTQFDRQSDATLKDLPQRNIDTGMGLERTAAVLQGVESNFEIDTFSRLRRELKSLLKSSKPAETDRQLFARENAVMDHMRAVTFCIGDGALPSNEGRGYVVRKLIRLASEHFRHAGPRAPGDLHKLVPAVTAIMGAAYPELAQKEKMISSVVENEERSYLTVIEERRPQLRADLKKLHEEIAKQQRDPDPRSDRTQSKATAIAFKYYDTYGLPIESIAEEMRSAGTQINEERFKELMEQQKKRSRETSKISEEIFSKKGAYGLADDLARTEFTGYHATEGEGTILRLIRKDQKADHLSEGEEGLLILDKTPFYAEAGGQVGDTGRVAGERFEADVVDTQYLEKATAHRVKVRKGRAAEGDVCRLAVDAERRADIMKNHTATHLLHSALRKVLGDHVKQSGSLVAPDRLRFDFTHFKAVDAASLEKVERLVNEQIQKNISLEKKIVKKEAAMEEGAIAFFGEKYEEEVRVVTIGDFSKELCGGTHLSSTGEIGLFKILSEGSVQAGVRRIEAVTGRKARQTLEESRKEASRIAAAFGVPEENLSRGLSDLGNKISSARARLFDLTGRKVREKIKRSLDACEGVRGAKLVSETLNGADVDLFKAAADELKQSGASYAALLLSESGGKVSFVVSASEDLVKKGFHSGKIVKAVASVVEGSGGGRPDFAVGGGKSASNKAQAVEKGLSDIRQEMEKILK